MNRLKKISIHKEVKSKTQYLCKCDICGYEEIVRDDRYETSVCKQCYKKELDKVRNQGIRTNYQMKTILLHWMRMIDNFEVVEEWKKFLNFYRDVYDRYMIVHDKQIDANDVIFIKPIDGILTPDNFKFDIKFSKKRRQEYEYRGIKLTWRQLIECSGTTEKVVRNRLADNWDIEEIFSTPSKLIGTNKPTQKEIDSIKLEEHNNLKIIERIDGFARDKEKHLNFFIKVRCKCGNEFITNNKAYQLLSSCGCIPNKQLTFDYEITKNYWKNLISRFRKQKLSYTPNWDNFDNFLDEVGYKPENKVLRRIDENIEYGKNNVVWINPVSEKILFEGQLLTLFDVSKKIDIGIWYLDFLYREKHMSIDEIIEYVKNRKKKDNYIAEFDESIFDIVDGKKVTKFVVDKDIAYGILSEKDRFMISIEDLDKMKNYFWRVSENGYIYQFSGHGRIGLANMIMNTMHNGKNIAVDHKNHNKLDNRRENLRICTTSQNTANLFKPEDSMINYMTDSGKWLVKFDKKYFFDSFEDAKEFRMQYDIKRYGQFSIYYDGDAMPNDINPGDTIEVINAKFNCWQYEGKTDEELNKIFQEGNKRYSLGLDNYYVENKQLRKKE